MVTTNCKGFAGIVSVAILCVLCLGAFDSSVVMAKKKTKPAAYGSLRISSNPPGLAVEIDGKPYGTTRDNYLTVEPLMPGNHSVVVTLPDGSQWRRTIEIGAGRLTCLFVGYRPTPPVASSPCPYPVDISAPTQATDGTIVTYDAAVKYAGSKQLLYTWTVTPAAAKVLSGAGSPRIDIDTTGLAGQRLTATLVVDDGSGAAGCRQIVQAATYIPQVERRDRVSSQFDVCCDCASDDQKARLDNLAIELQNDPTTTAYVIAYSSRNSRQTQAKLLLTRARDYLNSSRGIDSSRIVTVEGGLRDQNCVELWLVPKGAAPPVPKP